MLLSEAETQCWSAEDTSRAQAWSSWVQDQGLAAGQGGWAGGGACLCWPFTKQLLACPHPALHLHACGAGRRRLPPVVPSPMPHVGLQWPPQPG